MLLKIGTRKYHLTIAFLYWYSKDNFNLLELFLTPLFGFVICLWKPAFIITFRRKPIIWLSKGHNVFCDKLIFKGEKLYDKDN